MFRAELGVGAGRYRSRGTWRNAEAENLVKRETARARARARVLVVVRADGKSVVHKRVKLRGAAICTTDIFNSRWGHALTCA